MTPMQLHRLLQRRVFLGQATRGLGALALASLFNPSMVSGAESSDRLRGVVQPFHFAPKAKRVIHLCMAGGPSHLETFDFKPKLKRIHGQPFPESFTKGQQLAQLQNTTLLAR